MHPHALCINFAHHLVTKGNFHTQIARHLALIIIFNGTLIGTFTVALYKNEWLVG